MRQAITHIRESRWFESMYTSRGNLIHMTCMLPALVHVRHTYASCGQSLYVATFRESSTALDRVIAPEKKKLPATSLAHRLTDLWVPIQFLSYPQPLKQWRKPSIHWQTSYISLLGPYHRHVISTFNTCSRGPTHQSLTDTGRGYNLGGAGLPHHTPRPSQPTVLHFPPKGPARSQVIKYQHKLLAILRVKHRVASMPLDLYRTYNYVQHHANCFQVLVRSSRIIWKLVLMQLWFQAIPTNLMHNQS
jgi:hypothetical protein